MGNAINRYYIYIHQRYLPHPWKYLNFTFVCFHAKYQPTYRLYIHYCTESERSKEHKRSASERLVSIKLTVPKVNNGLGVQKGRGKIQFPLAPWCKDRCGLLFPQSASTNCYVNSKQRNFCGQQTFLDSTTRITFAEIKSFEYCLDRERTKCRTLNHGVPHGVPRMESFIGRVKYIINMVKHLDEHTFFLFRVVRLHVLSSTT